MSNFLYLDIETIPSQSAEVHARIAEGVTPPATMTKPETIAAWEADKKPLLVKEAIAKTALDGSAGHICCIGFCLNAGSPLSSIIGDVDDEKIMLDETFAYIEKTNTSYQSPTIVGHNVINFDIRFIWQRAIILGVRLPHWFPRDPKPWSGDVFDTMTAFAGQRNTIGMSRLCDVLGLEGKGEIDGSMVGDLWARGEEATISKYCEADVERTRAIHRKMLVAYGEAA